MKKNLHIEDVYREVSDVLKNPLRNHQDFSGLDQFPLIEGKQAIYVVDWEKGGLSYTRGIEAMLGYNESESEVHRCVHNYHPEDTLIMNRIIRGLTLHAVQTDMTGSKEYMNLTYRLRKKDGDYIKVLRQSSSYEVDVKGRMISNWSMLTDISFISNNNRVEWDIYANDLSTLEFKKKVFAEFASFFTPRELQIIRNMAKRKTNAEIAATLHISPHTVSTHRKNIFRKSSCSSVAELMAFCYRNGIL